MKMNYQGVFHRFITDNSQKINALALFFIQTICLLLKNLNPIKCL